MDAIPEGKINLCGVLTAVVVLEEVLAMGLIWFCSALSKGLCRFEKFFKVLELLR